MSRHSGQSARPRRRARLRVHVKPLAALTLLTGLLQPLAAQQAHAAIVTCKPEQSVFAVHTDGTLYRYPFDDLSNATTPVLAGPRTAVGAGWNQFGRVIGGANGWIFGIKSNGAYAYHWDGAHFNVQAQRFDGIATYAGAEYRKKIAADSSGRIYMLDANGVLRVSEYDPAENRLTTYARPIEQVANWSTLVGAESGVIYGMSGSLLQRVTYDFASDRRPTADWVSGNTDWSKFGLGLTSVGGETILGIEGSGRLAQFALGGGTPITDRTIGSGWNQFSDVLGITNECTRTPSVPPVTPPSLPSAQNAPVSVLAGTSSLEYAYTDPGGRSFWGHPAVPSDIESPITWTFFSSAMRGTPTLTRWSDGRLLVAGQHTDSSTTSASQTAVGATTLGTPIDHRGLMSTVPVPARYSWYDGVRLVAADQQGSLWEKPQPTESSVVLGSWHPVSGLTVSVDSDFAPATVEDRGQRLLMRSASGDLWFDAPVIATKPEDPPLHCGGGWLNLGNPGSTARPAVVTHDSGQTILFGVDAAGRVMSKTQAATGQCGFRFGGTWTPVGPPAPVQMKAVAGVVSKRTGLVELVAVSTDGRPYVSYETSAGAATWGEWRPVLQPTDPRTFVSAPTAFQLPGGTTPRWAFVLYNVDGQITVFADTPPVAQPAMAIDDPWTIDPQHAVTAYVLPSPPPA